MKKSKPRPIRVLITGGPTKAYLDRVRYLSNYSSGEVAYETCRELSRFKAKVAAVLGPSEFQFESLNLQHCRRVETFQEMRKAVHSLCRSFKPDVVVFAAAVLDFIPTKTEKGKISSTNKNWVIRLKPAPKIIDEVGRLFPSVQRVGFKLEWKKASGKKSDMARRLVQEKSLDALCLNFLAEIRGKRHPAVLYRRDTGEWKEVKTKREIAVWIRDYVFSVCG